MVFQEYLVGGSGGRSRVMLSRLHSSVVCIGPVDNVSTSKHKINFSCKLGIMRLAPLEQNTGSGFLMDVTHAVSFHLIHWCPMCVLSLV